MFLVFNREMPLFFFFPNPKGREGILLQQEEKEEEEETASGLPCGPCWWGCDSPGLTGHFPLCQSYLMNVALGQRVSARHGGRYETPGLGDWQRGPRGLLSGDQKRMQGRPPRDGLSAGSVSKACCLMHCPAAVPQGPSIVPWGQIPRQRGLFRPEGRNGP